MVRDGAIPPSRLAALLRPWLDDGPIYQGLATGLRSLILDGRVPVGSRVPSERVFASVLHVGRITVSSAYDMLRREGYLSSSSGAGSWVALPASAPVRPDQGRLGQRDRWDLTVAALSAPAQLVDALGAASTDLRPLLAGHGLHPLGLPALRVAVADHFSARGLPTSFDQVLITNGALHGWHLVLQVLTRNGDRVAVEQPTYPAVLDAVVAHRGQSVALPVSSAGWDGSPQQRSRVALLTPDGQNPTGFVADNEQRQRVLRNLESDVVVCDETFVDLSLDGLPARPLGSFDSRVITLGSMSKSFWAGLRVGWIRAERDVIGQLAQARAMTDMASPVLEQLVAHWFLTHAAPVLEERRALARRNRDALVSALTAQLPSWHFDVPAAGLFLWVELPEPGATRLAEHALDAGLRLTPGPRFTIDGTADRWFRLPFTLPPDEVETMVSVLKRAAMVAGSSPRGRDAAAQWVG